MAFNNYIARIERIDNLIRLKATGSPQELADKLGICKRMVYEYIDEMKAMGAPVEYCRERSSYIYREDGGFNLSFIKRKNNLVQ